MNINFVTNSRLKGMASAIINELESTDLSVAFVLLAANSTRLGSITEAKNT
jgi:hypothetical protein